MATRSVVEGTGLAQRGITLREAEVVGSRSAVLNTSNVELDKHL